MQLSSLNVQLPGGVIEARGSIALGGATPRYRLAGDVSGFPWNDGVISASGHLDSSGTGADTLLNLRAAGAFDGSDLICRPTQYSTICRAISVCRLKPAGLNWR